MQKTHIEDIIHYDGSQLRHAFAYEQADILGESIVSFIGPAEVSDHLVDLEDSINDDYISSADMLHFIIEIPNISVREAVLWQRSFMQVIVAELVESQILGKDTNIFLDGDDIMVKGHKDDSYSKFSVSIATCSLFSGLIHAGLNIKVGNRCPVSAKGFEDFAVCGYPIIINFAEKVKEIFVERYCDITRASYKVIGV